ncbi:hypothetical protein ZTR_09066 [Talaromyces verruculosus]|nr:hypothetical protein ZTR_09066 [Talaromyces verruculosus]
MSGYCQITCLQHFLKLVPRVSSVAEPLRGHSTFRALEPEARGAGEWFSGALGSSQSEALDFEFPPIFPSPRLSLASQVVPYFATPRFTTSDRSRLLARLEGVNETFPNHRLPSNDALTRYLAGYFTGFYPHCPFTHVPTFKIASCSQELCLAMMAVGALDRFENSAANQLFYLAKALLLDSQECRVQYELRNSVSNTNDPLLEKQLIDEMRCLLCLAQFASWQSDPRLKIEACVLQSLLGRSLRVSGLEENSQALGHLSWEQWSELESQRRTKLFSYCFLAIQSIAYDVPPIIWYDEINIKLPCSCPEWTAPDATTWSMLKSNIPNEQSRFHDTLNTLLSLADQAGHVTLTSTPVANYVLMHGLLQMIIQSRRSVFGHPLMAPSKEYQSTFEMALMNWTSCWVHTPESNLEPADPNGPLPFTSSALLSLAYIRNCFDTFRTKKLFTWNPVEIADVLRTFPSVERSRTSLLAAYHATNLLATLVKLGVRYFINNQAVLWSIEATLCGLDSSIFLEKWLRQVQDTMPESPLTDREIQLLRWIENIVCEGLSSVNDLSSDRAVQGVDLPDQGTFLSSTDDL